MKEINLKEKSLTEISDFIKNEISFNEMKKNEGIYETNSIGKDSAGDDVTIGISYEDIINKDENLEDCYYYNIFVGDTYIDLGKDCIGYKSDKIPLSTLFVLKKEIDRILV